MAPIRFILIGGFLGAGKTTTIARLARAYQDRGRSVGVVTNDQAADLVDTRLLRSQGFAVGEVAGACFCCNFGELTETIERLEATHRPDVLLAEPVGSCMDLAATVLQPLQRLGGGRFDIAPFGVLLKPSHGLRILGGGRRAGFSPQAEYLFTKQLEEADFLVINRIDEIPAENVERLADWIRRRRPDAPVLRMSARTGEGFDQLLKMLERQGDFGRRLLDLDYDRYAAAEAELGWLNSSLQITSRDAFELDDLLLEIVRRARQSLIQAGAETAHLKTIGYGDGRCSVVQLTANDDPAELSHRSGCRTKSADLVINARVVMAPESLQTVVEEAVRAACRTRRAEPDQWKTQSFRPGRPVPTHRMRLGELQGPGSERA